MKPPLSSLAALLAATSIRVIAGSPPTRAPAIDTASSDAARADDTRWRRPGAIDATVTDERGRHVPDLGSRRDRLKAHYTLSEGGLAPAPGRQV